MSPEQRKRLEQVTNGQQPAIYYEDLRALLTAYDEAQRDAERLDWCERNAGVQWHPIPGDRPEWLTAPPSLRYNIDAAMRAERGK